MKRPLARLRFLAIAAVALTASICSAGPQSLVPLADGRIRQGPFLLFGDQKGALHLMRGSEVIVRGMALYCGNGGYWPYDQMANAKVSFGPGTLTFEADVPGKQMAYEQHVSIVGNRIRFLIRRRGSWGESGWDSFSVWLPIPYYRGAQYSADGQAGTYPAKYTPERPYLASGVRRWESNLGEPSLNLTFECADGINVSDARRFGGQSYRIGVGVPRQATDGSVELFLKLPQLPEEAGAALRCSRIGYPIEGVKLVVLEWPRYASRPDDRVRLERADGTVVKQGRFGETVDPDYAQSSFASFDFSEVKEPGDYRIVWRGGAVEFPIRNSVFHDGLWQPTLDVFIPFEMCHADVDLGEGVPDHRRCHMDDAIRVPADFPGVDGFRSYECQGTPYAAGDRIPCAKGGWHDAGDCDVNVNAQAFAVWALSLAYEEFGLERDVATLDPEAQAWTRGKPDGAPDVLQQVEWGVYWLLSMLQPDGRTFVGVVAQPDRRSLGGKTWREATDNKPGTGDERHLYVDYHADLQLMQTISLCAASRVLRRTKPELARQCIEGAVKAFDYFRTHEEVYRKTVYFYPDRKGRDGMVAATLAELYLTTREPAYLGMLQQMAETIRNLELSFPYVYSTSASTFWYAPPFLARLYAVLPEGELKDAVREVCRRAAQIQSDLEAPRPWPFGYWNFGKWGNSTACVVRVFDAYWLSRVAPDVFSVADTVRSMLWVFGLHPLNDMVFVSGVGHPGPTHLHSGQIVGLFGREPGTVPGALVPGINGIFSYVSPNVLYYMDDGTPGNSEAGVYSSVLYVFAVNALKKSGF